VRAAVGLTPASWSRAQDGGQARQVRWVVYAVAGGVSAATVGPYLVVVLIVCGLVELTARVMPGRAHPRGTALVGVPVLGTGLFALGSLGAVAWVAFKVGALSYGGGFVIIPLMQHDAVQGYHWMTSAQFLDAVAFGQITPGPVVQTVAVVGYAASGLVGGLLAAVTAFTPSFVFVIAGGPHFDRLRRSARVQAFVAGAGPAAIGAIAGAAIPLGRALSEPWQVGVLVLAALWLLVLRRGVVSALVLAGALGVVATLAGLALPA
jgi:chromate transporter